MAEGDPKQAIQTCTHTVPPKAPISTQSYLKFVQEAPYRALVGVQVRGPRLAKPSEVRRCRIRRQTGLTNRWRLADPLYGDLLGSCQALKSINMPFNQTLVKHIVDNYPNRNEALDTCKESYRMNKTKWSLLMRNESSVSKSIRDSDSSSIKGPSSYSRSRNQSKASQHRRSLQ